MLPASELLGNECKRLLCVLGGGAGLVVAENSNISDNGKVKLLIQV